MASALIALAICRSLTVIFQFPRLPDQRSTADAADGAGNHASRRCAPFAGMDSYRQVTGGDFRAKALHRRDICNICSILKFCYQF